MNVTVVEVAGYRRAVVLDWVAGVRVGSRAGYLTVEVVPVFGGETIIVWQHSYPEVTGGRDFSERVAAASSAAQDEIDRWVALLADVPRPDITVVPL